MADYDRIMTALRNAHKAGDTKAAQRLAKMAVAAREAGGVREPDAAAARQGATQDAGAAVPDRNADGTYGQLPEGFVLNPETGQMVDMRSPNNPHVREGAGRAAMQGAGQGLSFGGMDEVVAGARAVTGSGTMGENYRFAKETMDEELRRAREQHPWVTGGAEVAGGVASGVAATAGIAPAATLAGKVAQAAGIGAGTGAVYGGLSADGGAQDRLEGGAKGALIGGGAGLAAIPVEAGLRAAGAPIMGAIANISSKAKPDRVEAALAQAIAASGRTPRQLADDILRAEAEGQNVFGLADAMGASGQRALSGTARLGGTARREVSDFLETRQAGQGERIAATLSDGLNTPQNPGKLPVPHGQPIPGDNAGRTAEQVAASMRGARSKAADKAYGAARKGAAPVDVRGALAAIDDRIGPMQGSGIKGDGIDARLSGYRARLASKGREAFPDAAGVELSDFDRVLGVKQAVQDDIGAALRAGRNNEARELGKLVDELDGALEAASPDYRAANDAFRKSSREIDQIDAGKAASSPARRADDVVAEYGKLTPQERAAYRAGYADRQMAKIEGAAVGVDKSRPFTSPKSKAELAAMAKDPEKLARVLGREQVMFETRRQAVGGSQTADNLADMGGISGAVRRAPRSLVDALATGAEWTARMAKGQNEATRAALAKALISTGDEAAANIAKAVARGEALTKDQQRALRTILYLQQQGGLQVER